jgi:hypothetical protein
MLINIMAVMDQNKNTEFSKNKQLKIDDTAGFMPAAGQKGKMHIYDGSLTPSREMGAY